MKRCGGATISTNKVSEYYAAFVFHCLHLLLYILYTSMWKSTHNQRHLWQTFSPLVTVWCSVLHSPVSKFLSLGLFVTTFIQLKCSSCDLYRFIFLIFFFFYYFYYLSKTAQNYIKWNRIDALCVRLVSKRVLQTLSLVRILRRQKWRLK